MNDKNGTPKLGKGAIAAFAIMGTAIVMLTIALIVSINSKPDNPAEIPVQGDSTTTSQTSSTDGSFSTPDSGSVPTVDNPDVNPPSSSSVASTGNTSAPQSEQQSSQSTPQSSVPQQSSSTPVSSTAQPEQLEQPEQSQPTGTGVTLKYSIDNSWESGNVLMYGLQFGVTNSTGKPISNWKLVMNIDGLDSCTGWNAAYYASGNTLTVTNTEHNGTINNGGTVVFGCNLGSTKSFKITSATINGTPCTVTAGYVNQNDQSNQQQNNQQNNQQQNNQQNATKDVSELLKRPENAVQGDDWLFTDGNRIVDKNGKRVWLTGVNWFGYNTGTNTFDGLWNSQLEPSVKAIADHGFNLIRVPISAELINQWAAGEYPRANYNNAYNTALNGMNSLEIFEYFLALAEQNGIKVMPDIHSAETDASGHVVNLWYTSKISAEEYYSALEWMADRYKNNDTIIAYDLKNEPHGKPFEGSGAAVWNDSKSPNNWKYTAEVAAARILAKNPNVLILVEGTEIYPIDIKNNSDFHSTDSKDYYFNWWGGNLRGVKDFPVNLGKYQNKLVYSPHDYGPTVYQQPWFEGDYTFDSLMKDCWKDNWFYIHEQNTAPLLIGEWGGFMKEPNLKWMTYMRKLIKDNKLNHTFWCFNANSGDTGGLVLDDFKTWDEQKYAFVKEVLWQENGKFVGLDHAIPLGENGITLAKASGIK